jgi:predicted DNA-binding transcriptional regulator AlpA
MNQFQHSTRTETAGPERDLQLHHLLTELQASTYLNVAVKTLQNYRWLGQGPRFVKLGKRMVRYRLSDLENFVTANLRSSTSQGEE